MKYLNIFKFVQSKVDATFLRVTQMPRTAFSIFISQQTSKF